MSKHFEAKKGITRAKNILKTTKHSLVKGYFNGFIYTFFCHLNFVFNVIGRC